MELSFEWDEDKAQRNTQKHGVTFEEAKTALNDPLAIAIPDPDHSEREDRWLTVGRVADGHLLVVWYTERGDTVRIIGARRATRPERRAYENEPR